MVDCEGGHWPSGIACGQIEGLWRGVCLGSDFAGSDRAVQESRESGRLHIEPEKSVSAASQPSCAALPAHGRPMHFNPDKQERGRRCIR
jgi:hypothetical protein